MTLSKKASVAVPVLLISAGAYFLQRKIWPPSAVTSAALDSPQPEDLSNGSESSALAPLPAPTHLNMDRIELGYRLFVDVRLSKNNSVACVSCHDLNKGGADKRQFSVGILGQLGHVNAPSVFNSSFNFRQFWDGRASSLKDQLEGPLHNPVEMGTQWPDIVEKLDHDENYVSRFQKAYGEKPSRESVADALVEFEKALVTEDAPFDRYLKGEKDALTLSQMHGYQKFTSLGCVACHQGRNVGGNMYQTLGIAGDYFKDRGGFFESDLGRYNVTGREQDRHMFRVPSLRNVELSAPYFHDGTVKTLQEAVHKMGHYQLGRELSNQDVHDLVEFLKSLTGNPPKVLVELEGKKHGPASE